MAAEEYRHNPGLKRSTLYVDVTDYLVYFSSNQYVSGIQRVEANLLRHLASASHRLGPFLGVRYCLTNPKTGEFALVSADDIAHIQVLLQLDRGCLELNEICRQVINNSLYSRLISLQDDDLLVFLGPPFATPYQLDAYLNSRKESCFSCIAVCHDLLPLEYPEFFPASLPTAFGIAHAKLQRLADGFICNSRYTLESVKAHDFSSGYIRPSEFYDYWTLGDFEPAKEQSLVSKRDADRYKKVLKILQRQSYVLIVSTLEPRKNHQTVLRAWRLLVDKARQCDCNVPTLVFAGKVGWSSQSLLAEIDSLNASGIGIFHMDGISDQTMSWLYTNCLFTIMPSYAEGFGLSIAETISHGKVCLTSNSTAMPEVGSSSLPYFDPYNARDLYDKMWSLIYDGKLPIWKHKLLSRARLDWIESSIQFYNKLFAMYRAIKT